MTLMVKNIPNKRWWDVWIAVITVIIIVMVGGRLWVTDWTNDLDLLVYLTFFAGVTGLALGYSNFSTLMSALFSTVYGVFIIGWLFGTTVEMEMTWRERIFDYLRWRVSTALADLSAGEVFVDPILFLGLMAILFWIIGSIAAFTLVRQKSAWPLIVPMGIVLLIIGHYDQHIARNNRFLVTFLFLSLLILGRITYLDYLEKWRQEGVHTSVENKTNLSKSLVLLAAAMIVFAWIIPLAPQQITWTSPAWQWVTSSWDQLGERFSSIFVFDTATPPVSAVFFDESMALGSGSPASEETVFTVEPETEPPVEYRHYWRARSYDFYEQANWSSSPNLRDRLLFPDNFNLQYPEWAENQTITYTFTTYFSRTINLFTTGVPVWASQPVEAIIQPLPGAEEDLIGLIASPNLSEGDSYQIAAQMFLPSVTELQNSSMDYPAWLNRYLQLPPDFSPEIASLAETITEGRENPYAIAFEITRYLRNNIRYTRTIATPPPDQDPLVWFLFEEKAGFCNYYASVQVLMLRSLGVPTRLAVGYAEGEYDPESATYNVRRLDSHAWPEVYFLGYGWVPFEPTASQPAIVLPAVRQQNGIMDTDPLDELALGEFLAEEDDLMTIDIPENLPGMPGITSDQPSQTIEAIRMLWTMLAIFLVVLVIAVTLLFTSHNFNIEIVSLPVLLERMLSKHDRPVPDWLRRWSAYARMSPAGKAYRQLGRSVQLMGQRLNLAETPAERAQTLINMLPDAEPHIQAIVDDYQLDQYSEYHPNEENIKHATREVRRQTWKARLRKLNPLPTGN